MVPLNFEEAERELCRALGNRRRVAGQVTLEGRSRLHQVGRSDQPAKAQAILDGAREHFPDLVPQAEQETCKKRIARVRQEIMPAVPATAALAFG